MKILTVPHRLLFQEAAPVEMFDTKLQCLIDRMYITMYNHKGIGLAANQVGILKQVVVININHDPLTMINPTVKDLKNGRIWLAESCLSVPDYTIAIERAYTISVKSLNRNGQIQNFKAEGLLARIIQHEVDHLHGILI